MRIVLIVIGVALVVFLLMKKSESPNVVIENPAPIETGNEEFAPESYDTFRKTESSIPSPLDDIPAEQTLSEE